MSTSHSAQYEAIRRSSSSSRQNSWSPGSVDAPEQGQARSSIPISARCRVMIGLALGILASIMILIAIGVPGHPSSDPNADNGPVIDLGYGRYQGVYNAEFRVNLFFGMRYAAPPMGKYRWKLPIPIESSDSLPTSVISASLPASACIQGVPYWRQYDGRPRGSEDCLLLNIVQPATATPDSGLPVLVNIHGGGYTMGNGSWQSGLSFMKRSENAIIYVSIQYRLGAYGFLGSSDFIKQGGTANLGFFDQRAALLWVQTHISLFGGDPTKVTIMGDSAGGGSVTAQLMWSGGERHPPFRAAIAQYPWWQRFSNEEQLTYQYHSLLKATNCKDLECMRSLSEKELANAAQTTFTRGNEAGAYGYGTFFYGPSIAPPFIHFLPSQAFDSGNFSRIPLLTNHNKWEGFGFTPSDIDETRQAIDLLQQFPNAGKGFFQRFYELYRSEDFESTFWQRQAWFGDFMVNCPTRVLTSSFVAYDVPVWKMIFNSGSKIHGATAPFLFDLDYKTSERGDAKIAGVMIDWVVSFVIHGNPNTQRWNNDEHYTWPRYGEEGNIVMINDSHVGIARDSWFDDSERCKFWIENTNATQN